MEKTKLIKTVGMAGVAVASVGTAVAAALLGKRYVDKKIAEVIGDEEDVWDGLDDLCCGDDDCCCDSCANFNCEECEEEDQSSNTPKGKERSFEPSDSDNGVYEDNEPSTKWSESSAEKESQF